MQGFCHSPKSLKVINQQKALITMTQPSNKETDDNGDTLPPELKDSQILGRGLSSFLIISIL
jgi:hypothetical protein